ncbi:MAG TPA: class I SAM-dependent methyltransferase [Candidatus Dormibacteraeota bacterium]|nr:class I SAM-dependent methyltransferase [Candidatus Dormibacteraeota bacterium]
MSFFFRAAYLVGFKPWDSGVPPPQLVAVVEGSNALSPQKALDLGCGTGTNSIYMAGHGWDVTGIDFVPRAVTIAKRKAAEAQVSPRLMVGDVTRLTDLGIETDYSLLLDLGCFHSIPDAGRDAYVRGVTAHARAGATFLIFGFVRSDARASRVGPRGLAPAEVAQRFAGGWVVDAEERGGPMFGSAAYWYTLHRR